MPRRRLQQDLHVSAASGELTIHCGKTARLTAPEGLVEPGRFCNSRSENKKGLQFLASLFLCFGAGTKSRTRDLLITSQLLYQLSYTGAGCIIYRQISV